VDIADGDDSGPISAEATGRAAAWCDLLEAHARRVYHLAGAGDSGPARLLAEKLRRGELPNPFTYRELTKRGWSGLGREEIPTALSRLERDGYLRSAWEEEHRAQRDGRPARRYYRVTAPGATALNHTRDYYRKLAGFSSRSTSPARSRG
jgi:hypothetical protein